MVVGIMAINPREKVATLIDSAKFAIDIPSKLGHLRRLRGELSHADVALLSHSLPSLLNLHTDRFSPVRKFITELIGNIGLKWMQLLPEIVPVLLTVLKDGTPAVARQAITCGTDLFRSTVVKIAIQGMHSTELDDFLESSWAWVLKLRDEVYSIAFQSGSDGKRLLALKFVEAIILLYTPDPSGSLEPPDDQTIEEKSKQFNISWLRGGHPVLKIGDLSIEASQSLGLLLDQLRFPTVKSLSNLTVIVLINSLSSIAKKRPSFYGRILPVLLGLDPSSSFGQELYISGVYHALKNAFISCLKCSHPSAAPWRDRLDGALREINAGGSAKQTLNQVSQIDGNVEWKSDSSFIKEEKPTIDISDAVQNIAGRKRAGVQEESGNLFEDDDASGKRARQTPNDSDGSTQEASRDQPAVASSGSKIYRGNGDNGPVQQLVAMFGALVAQGEKAIGSLEILVSSISADLLAEVVMANMQHLPPSYPNADGNREPLLNLGSHPKIVDHETQIKQLSSFLTDLLSLSSGISTTYSVLDSKQSASNELEKVEEDKNHVATTANSDAACSVLNYASDQAPTHTSSSVLEDVPSVRETGSSSIPLESADIGNLVGEIPGLDSFVPNDALPGTLLVSSLPSTEVEESSQEQITSLGKMPMDLLPSVSADRSEELSPKEAATDVTSVHSSTATSVGQSKVILPKMSAPVIDLEDKQKDKLQIFAYMRIIEAYRQVAVAGGSQVRFSLLAYLGVEYPLELDPWKLLHTHIMSDYTIHEGHELTLRVLFRLFGEAERESDFFSSTSATSVYEIFLLTVAETLKDSFPASDKSLSRLLNEVPYLPKSIYNLLESLCSPGSNDKEDKEFHTGDRVTQGLSAVWSLILLRPPIRDVCLNIALQSAVHHLEEVRMKAIRLVANKLYPLSSISQQIEEFAKEMLLSVAKLDPVDRKDADGSNPGLLKDQNMEKPSDEHSSVCALTKEVSSDAGQSCTSESISSSLIEVQRCTSLYFALCTKKHSLLRQIFVMYTSISDTVKQVVRRQIPILVRTIGSSSELLDIVSDPPTGSEDLLMQVLHTLTDGTVPSQELVTSIKKLYDTKLKDIQILIPILPSLPREEILLIFRHIIHLPLDKFQAALARLLQGSSHSGPILTAAEILIAIHGINPDRDGIPLKKVTDACNACFEQREIFTQQVLAKVLNHLVEQIPLPLLFMRTVLQALGAFPSLMEFIMEILSRLVSKQIWKYPKLWVGFLKCAILTKPQSFSVLLQLPPAQLEAALNRTPALKAPLSEHANQPNIRLSLPRSVLVVLGVVSDSQVSVQAQASGSQDGDAGNLDKQAVTEKSKESPSIN